MLSHEWALLRTTSTGVVKILANGAEIPGSNQELFLLRKTEWAVEDHALQLLFRPSAREVTIARYDHHEQEWTQEYRCRHLDPTYVAHSYNSSLAHNGNFG